jgi:hypothetical protein
VGLRAGLDTEVEEKSFAPAGDLKYCTRVETLTVNVNGKKAVPLHTMEALGGRGGIAPTHSRPRH